MTAWHRSKSIHTEIKTENSYLGCHDLTDASNHALVVLGRLQLDARLDDVEGANGRVRDAAADPTGERRFEVIVKVVHSLLVTTWLKEAPVSRTEQNTTWWQV